MQVIKQGVHMPLPVVKQIVVIYAGVNGFLDDIPPNKIYDFQRKLFDDLDSLYADFAKLLEKEKTITPEIQTALEKLIVDFKTRFNIS